MKPPKDDIQDAKRLIGPEEGTKDPMPQVVKIIEAPIVEPPKPVVRRHTSANVLGVDSLAPRRLSQLFVPLKQDELESEEAKVDESSNLLENQQEVVTPPRHVEYFKKPIQNSESTSKDKSTSDIESHSSSKCGNSTDSNSDDEDDKGPSMDDTICSNRSSYFKYYYLGSKGGEDTKSRTSTRASSLTSLASLIKERKTSMIGKKDKKGARDDIGLMVLVIVLFLFLVIGISLIYYFYYKHLLQLSLFKRLKYNEEKRLLELFDSNGSLDIIAQMGSNLPPFSKPEECTEYLKYIYAHKNLYRNEVTTEGLNETVFSTAGKASVHEFQFDNETVCLDWAHRARVQIHNAPSYESVSCYNVFWLSHLDGVDLEDCFHISSNEAGVWWGIGELTGGGYPLENVKDLPETRFLTSDLKNHRWGKILRRVFISSNGGIITLPDHLPARLQLVDKKLCISANASDFVNAHRTLTLNYTICSSPNMSATVGYLNFLAQDETTNISVSDDYESHVNEIISRIENPTWIPYMENVTISQDSVLKYVEAIRYKNRKVSGNVLLPLTWQEKIGHFTFDKVRFPDPENLTKTLAEMGYNLVLTISPIVATDTKSFEEGIIEGYWVQQIGSDLPILLRSDGVSAAALTDFTNPHASDWFLSQIRNVQSKYGINKFHLSAPESNSFSVYHEFHNKIPNPDLYFQTFLKSVSTIVDLIGTDAAIVPPPLPTFVTIGSLQSDWNSLETLIPRILTLSMLGYPLIDAGPIGGTPHVAPEPELYIRWVQVAAFLPVFQINVVPNVYDKQTKTIVEKYIKLRKEVVIPRLSATINHTMIDKYPLVSPLGLLYPHDLTAAAISDEWIIGKDLLVAPILSEGATTRDIYIPEGLWESQSNGKLKKGPGWAYNYEVPLTDLAFFVKRYSITLSG